MSDECTYCGDCGEWERIESKSHMSGDCYRLRMACGKSKVGWEPLLLPARYKLEK